MFSSRYGYWHKGLDFLLKQRAKAPFLPIEQNDCKHGSKLSSYQRLLLKEPRRQTAFQHTLTLRRDLQS